MTVIKNGQISLCHFNRIIKEPGTCFQSLALSQEHVKNLCHTAIVASILFPPTKNGIKSQLPPLFAPLREMRKKFPPSFDPPPN